MQMEYCDMMISMFGCENTEIDHDLLLEDFANADQTGTGRLTREEFIQVAARWCPLS